MPTRNVAHEGVEVNPLRGQNNVQGSCDMDSFAHELPDYRHVSDTTVHSAFGAAWHRPFDPEPGLRIPNMFDAALDAPSCAGTAKASNGGVYRAWRYPPPNTVERTKVTAEIPLTAT